LKKRPKNVNVNEQILYAILPWIQFETNLSLLKVKKKLQSHFAISKESRWNIIKRIYYKILFKYTIKYFLIIVVNIIHSNLKANKNLHISIKMYFVHCKTSSYSWMIADLPWPFPVPVLPAELSPDLSRVSKRDRTQTIIASSPNEAGKLGHLEVKC